MKTTRLIMNTALPSTGMITIKTNTNKEKEEEKGQSLLYGMASKMSFPCNKNTLRAGS